LLDIGLLFFLISLTTLGFSFRALEFLCEGVGLKLGIDNSFTSCNRAGGTPRWKDGRRAVEFVRDKKTKTPFPAERNFAGLAGQACLRSGLLVYPMQGCVDGVAGDHLLIAPPAVITEEEIGWAVEQLRAAVLESV